MDIRLNDDCFQDDPNDSDLEPYTYFNALAGYKQMCLKDHNIKEERKRLIKERIKDKADYAKVIAEF